MAAEASTKNQGCPYGISVALRRSECSPACEADLLDEHIGRHLVSGAEDRHHRPIDPRSGDWSNAHAGGNAGEEDS